MKNRDVENSADPLAGATLPAEDVLGRVFSAGETLADIARAAGLNPSSDFRKLDLRGWDFEGIDVRGIDFSESDLRGTRIDLAQRDATTILTSATLDDDVSIANHTVLSEPSPTVLQGMLHFDLEAARGPAENYRLEFLTDRGPGLLKLPSSLHSLLHELKYVAAPFAARNASVRRGAPRLPLQFALAIHCLYAANCLENVRSNVLSRAGFPSGRKTGNISEKFRICAGRACFSVEERRQSKMFSAISPFFSATSPVTSRYQSLAKMPELRKLRSTQADIVMLASIEAELVAAALQVGIIAGGGQPLPSDLEFDRTFAAAQLISSMANYGLPTRIINVVAQREHYLLYGASVDPVRDILQMSLRLVRQSGNADALTEALYEIVRPLARTKYLVGLV